MEAAVPEHGTAPLPPSIERVVLTGFMGAGKSIVGRKLGSILGWQFVDLDEQVAELAGIPVPEIFRRHGEAHFRRLEVDALRASLPMTRVVLALGGGALESNDLFDAVWETPATAVLFLEAPLPELLRRCGGAGGSATRPLLRDAESAEARYHQRLPRYRKAHLTFHTGGVSTAETVRRIELTLRDRLVRPEPGMQSL